MKVWFGVIGRACLEFLVILCFISIVAGASASLAAETTTGRALFREACAAMPAMLPPVASAALFLSFFSFERRVRSRILGWVGTLLIGILLFGGGIAFRHLPILQRVAQPTHASASRPLQAAGRGIKHGDSLLWYRSVEGSDVTDAVAADFGSPYPRLVYERSAPLRDGSVDVGGRLYTATMPPSDSTALLPEASYYGGAWIWERLAAPDGSRLFLAAIASAGFLVLAAGFRFLARITRWPLANAFFAFAGFMGLFLLDASLASPTAVAILVSFAGPLADTAAGWVGAAGPAASAAILVAAVEGLVGLVLAAVDLAIAPAERRANG